MYESITGKVPIESIRLSWLLFAPGSPASRLFLFYKRLTSAVISIIGLLLTPPLLPFVALPSNLVREGRCCTRRAAWGAMGWFFVVTNFVQCA